MKYVFCFILSLIMALQGSECVNRLDCICNSFDNPLKEFKSFTVFLLKDAENTALLIQELRKIGTVKTYSMVDSNSVNFDGMLSGGPSMTCEINAVDVLGNSKESVMRISLLVSTATEVLKTKNKLSNAYIWGSNSFASKEKVASAIQQTVEQFGASYREANPKEKSSFHVDLF